jgi:glycosyltransferase involved in cell wall biosynthesis
LLDIAFYSGEPTAVDTQSREQAQPMPAAASGRPRVLHVLAGLTIGGIETWLMHMFRHHGSFSVDHEVLLTREEPGEYEDEARRLGIRIHKLPIGANKRAWLRSFRKFLEAEGPFTVVHSHLYLFSAPVLSEAKKAGVPVRIGHCHAARSKGSDHQNLPFKVRRGIAVRWMKRAATRRIGISEAAIEEIAGKNWRRDPASTILLYGFDFSGFSGSSDRAKALRENLGIAATAPVVGHVGRFDPVKNHAFLLEAFAAALRVVPDAQLVLVGDGPIRDEMAEKAKALGIGDNVHFPGPTDDVPAYMRMFDLFLLPSFSEGLGIVVVEAQAAGTRSIVSDAVAREASILPGAVEFLPLSMGPEAWGREIAARIHPRQEHRDDWLERVEGSNFGISRCIEDLDEIYRSELAGDR